MVIAVQFLAYVYEYAVALKLFIYIALYLKGAESI